MCGIAGKITFNEEFLKKNHEINLIRTSLEKLDHRGPDDNGYYIDKNVWLASTRLAIIDRSSAGHQPMQNEKGDLEMVFNGEIYNFLELQNRLRRKHKFRSNTDSEVLLHLYEDFGHECLKHLRGMFAFAIWDKNKQELFIARDRIGKKPIKYYFDKNFFIFASELKAFIDHPGISKIIDWSAIKEFMAFQYVLSPKTGFKNIYKLPPAHYMVVKPDHSIQIRKYWDIDFSQKLDLSESEWKDKIIEELKKSIKLRLRSDISLGIHLSGGIDSGIITAIACQESKNRIKTFSIGFDDDDYNELPYSRLIAEKYQTDHHDLVVKSDVLDLIPKLTYFYEEPFADPSILPTWCLMKESKKYFTVALNGDGGDENFAGYKRYSIMSLFDLLQKLPLKNRLSNALLFLYQYTHNRNFNNLANILKIPSSGFEFFYQDLVGFVRGYHRNNLFTGDLRFNTIESKANKNLIEIFEKVKDLDWLNRLLYTDIHSFLPEYLMAKNDISSMSNSIETRSPFLDYKFMELIAKMPSKYKFTGLSGKVMLKKIAEDYIPHECIYRKKQGFVPPLAQWFRGKYSNMLKEELLDTGFLKLNYLNKDYLNLLINDHMTYQGDNAYILWTILMFKKWYDCWFKRN
jgi:asparagine synthase (glutamine-hydrolysing)